MTGELNSFAEPMSVKDAVLAQAEHANFSLDQPQSRLLDHLLQLRESSPPHLRQRGLYVHGPVGRGKSWVTAAWFVSLQGTSKQRIHFHEFLERLHREVFAQRQQVSDGSELMDRVFSTLLGNVQVLLFDEFHVHDPGDGRLLDALLDYIDARQILLVVTSNYAPEHLMPDPAWHPLFAPTIVKITQRLSVFSLDGPTDYRRTSGAKRSGFANGTWLHRVPIPNEQVCGEQDHRHQTGRHDRMTVLRVRDRDFNVTSATHEHLIATFEQLCETPLSTIEYLEWARQFAVWTVTDVPEAAHMNPQTQQRLLNLVDIASDSSTTVNFVSVQELDAFIAQLRGASDVSRLASRLSLLTPDTGGGVSR